jgi:Zn-dependent protease with chaperone function
MLRRLWAILLAASLGAASLGVAAEKKRKQQEVKIQKTSLSRDQEIELGKQAAAEVEREMEVIKNPEIEGWLNKIGQNLAKTRQANSYPYYFKLVNEDSINAFALPGGPMFVHTGLIKAADNEGQVAGVLGHEMSHVALRHGAAQMGRSNTWQTILGAAGAASGIVGGGAGQLIGMAVNTGGSLGVASLLSKFSRGSERDADLNGARMVAEVGYNPIEVARFFEKLESQAGEAGKPKGLESWLSSHPNPGKRVQYVSEDIQFYPQKPYDANTGQFERVKKLVGSLPPPKLKPAAALKPVQAQPRQGLPQEFADLQLRDFAVAYPGTWKPGQGQQGGGIYIVPEGGAKQSQNGGVELILGGLVDYSPSPGDKRDLKTETSALLQALQKGDRDIKIEKTEPTTVGGKQALLTRLKTRTSYEKDPEQVVQLDTVVRSPGLWTFALASPTSFVGKAEPIFRQMIQTIKFAD